MERCDRGIVPRDDYLAISSQRQTLPRIGTRRRDHLVGNKEMRLDRNPSRRVLMVSFMYKSERGSSGAARQAALAMSSAVSIVSDSVAPLFIDSTSLLSSA